MIELFLKTFIFYFIVIDPIGSTPIFLVVTEHLDAKEKIKTALHGTLIATLILLFFGLLGNSILAYLNISFPAFTIAGGIILFIIALEMLFDKRHQRKEESVDFTSDKLSIFPLATPLLAGPAAITSVIVSVSATGNDFTKQAIGMLALITATLATFIILFIAAKSEKIINKKIISIFSRIVAIVLAGLSIQYILDGIKTFMSL
jgi:multiple antibiotic resistance protein